MNTARAYQIVLYRKEPDQLTLDALAACAGLHPAIVAHFVDLGILTPASRQGPDMLFDPSALSRLQRVVRLRSGLGINLAGISVVLDLVDKIYALQRENKLLRGRQPPPEPDGSD